MEELEFIWAFAVCKGEIIYFVLSIFLVWVD